MTVILLLFIAFCLLSATYKNPFSHEVFENNFEKDATVCINGIFVVFVFLSHFHFEIEKFYQIDSLYLKFQMLCGQCIVCSFLFYTGYGIYENLKQNRKVYVRKLILQKFPYLLLRFDFCVLLYAILQLALGNHVTITQLVLSLLTIKHLGNSNWYISYILLMYVVIWASFTLCSDDKKSLLLVVLANVLYTTLFAFFNGKASHYYVTSFVLPFGMYFSRYREQLEILIKKRPFLLFLISFLAYSGVWIFKAKCGLPEVTYNIISLLFTTTLILITYKLQIKSKILSMLGKNVFQIYILQHIPMILYLPVQKYTYGRGYILYLVLCVFTTGILTAGINWVFAKFSILRTL